MPGMPKGQRWPARCEVQCVKLGSVNSAEILHSIVHRVASTQSATQHLPQSIVIPPQESTADELTGAYRFAGPLCVLSDRRVSMACTFMKGAAFSYWCTLNIGIDMPATACRPCSWPCGGDGGSTLRHGTGHMVQSALRRAPAADDVYGSSSRRWAQLRWPSGCRAAARCMSLPVATSGWRRHVPHDLRLQPRHRALPCNQGNADMRAAAMAAVTLAPMLALCCVCPLPSLSAAAVPTASNTVTHACEPLQASS